MRPAVPVGAGLPQGFEQPPLQVRRTPTTPVVRGGSLPQEFTSFVGRRTEVAKVKNLLSAGKLVTLTGTGGVGKTRLALRAAATVHREFADGVWLVELADVSDPSLLIDVVAATLGLRDDPARPLPEVVADFLSTRESLVVLDNCEHLLGEANRVVSALVREAVGLVVLATSREPLGVVG